MEVTRKGDTGVTSLLNGEEVSKSSAVIFALSYLDRLNAELGLAKLNNPSLKEEITKLQNMLEKAMSRVGGDKEPLPSDDVKYLDVQIAARGGLGGIKAFDVPGANIGEVSLHLCRTSCRIAEAAVIKAKSPADVYGFINRLSLYLFVLAHGLKEK